MRQNQKYFPLFDAAGKLTERFLIVSNMRLADPKNIVHGNERVVRPRLADARFFFETDQKMRLAERVPQLAIDRLSQQARHASSSASSACAASRARIQRDAAARRERPSLRRPRRAPRQGGPGHAMVGEFPELQGVMGSYYAEADGEEPSVVRAIEQHYWPRFAGDQLPVGDVSIALALADKLETLVGIWGVGQQPTGDKDPFGLRRAALGVLRILSEKSEAASLDLGRLLDEAASGFPAGHARARHAGRGACSSCSIACARCCATRATTRTRSRRCSRAIRRSCSDVVEAHRGGARIPRAARGRGPRGGEQAHPEHPAQVGDLRRGEFRPPHAARGAQPARSLHQLEALVMPALRAGRTSTAP